MLPAWVIQVIERDPNERLSLPYRSSMQGMFERSRFRQMAMRYRSNMRID